MKRFSVLVVFVAPLWLGSCMKDIKNPEFLGVEDFKVHSLGLAKSQVRMNVRFFNPNRFPLELRKADVDISVNKRPLGKTLLDTIIQIPANDSFQIPVKMALDIKSVFPNILSLAGRDEVELGMVGTVRVKRSGFTVTVPVNYSGMQKINF